MNKYFTHIQKVLLPVGILALIVHSIITHRHTQALASSNKVNAELVDVIRENNKVSLENTKVRLERNQIDIQILELKEKDKK